MTPLEALAKYGTKRKAAKALGIPESTFRGILKRQPDVPRETRISIINPPKSSFTKILYFTDAHNQPGMPQDRLIWLAKLINDQKPDVVVDGGDFDDFQSLCSHERDDTYKGRLKPIIAQDLECAAQGRAIINKHLTHACRRIITLGNHEARIWSYENANPALYGVVSAIYEEILKSTGWEYKPYGEYVNISGVDFTHVPFNVLGKPVGGETACKQIADKSICDVAFGHSHKMDIWNAAKFGSARSVIAFNGGCFMPDGYIPDYSKDTRKEFWYGCHVLMVKDGRIKSIKSWHMSELEALYDTKGSSNPEG